MIFILFHNFRKIPIYCIIYVRSMCYLYFSTISSSIPNNQTINCSALIIICISFPHSIIVVSYYSKLDFNFLFQPFLKFHICRNQMFVLLFFLLQHRFVCIISLLKATEYNYRRKIAFDNNGRLKCNTTRPLLV
jgi:hypothetical protein